MHASRTLRAVSRVAGLLAVAGLALATRPAAGIAEHSHTSIFGPFTVPAEHLIEFAAFNPADPGGPSYEVELTIFALPSGIVTASASAVLPPGGYLIASEVTGPAPAQVDRAAEMKVFDIASFIQGPPADIRPCPGGSVKVVASDLTIPIYINQATPKFAQQLCKGDSLSKWEFFGPARAYSDSTVRIQYYNRTPDEVHFFTYDLREATTNFPLDSDTVAVPPGAAFAVNFELSTLGLPPAEPVEMVALTAVEIDPIKPPPPPPAKPPFGSLHSGSINILFADGSVKFIAPRITRLPLIQGFQTAKVND